MLSEKMREHGTRCYLINTGWSGGPYGIGSRIDLAATRQMVRAVIQGKLDGVETRTDPYFGLHVPVEVPDIPTELLDPRETWDDKDAYDKQAKELANLFAENFKKFEDQVDEEVLNAGPTS
jgi:phosphoenolpyruvate carboxykinase (ATP)